MKKMTSRYLQTLTKSEKRDLITAIDGVLDMIYVPIRKVDDEIGAVEEKMSKLLVSQWDSQTKKSVKEAAEMISGGSGPIGQDDIKMVLTKLADDLGPGLQALTPTQVTELVSAAYILGKEGISKEIGAKMTLKVEDVEMQKMLKEHHTYWILNHYDANLKKDITATVNEIAAQGLGRKAVGKELQKKLGSQFDRDANYWRLLGAAAVHRSRNLGGVQGLIDGGVKEYEILSVLDERTSDICRFMDGKVFRVEDAKATRDKVLAAQHPTDILDINPWHTAKQNPDGTFEIRTSGSKPWNRAPGQWTSGDGLSQQQLVKRGLALPPYHGFCRTTYIVATFKSTQAITKPFPIQFEDVVTAASTIPPLTQLTYKENGAKMGGAGEKHIYTDKQGNEYMFKPATSQAGKYEPFRAHVQEAASDIQKLVYDHDQFIEVKAVELNGKLGTIQRLKKDIQGDLKKAQDQLEQFPISYLEKIQGEQVIDWLISNHDAHGGQFIVTKAGDWFAIDKEQAFRYFPNDKLDWTYHPNKAYGEKEPIYNTLMRKWANSELDINPNHVLPYIKRIEAIDDADYKKLLEPYAKALHKSQAKQQEFLDNAVKRKQNIRKDFEELYSKAISKRIGKKYAFKFGDEMPVKEMNEAPLAVQAFSTGDLNKMTTKTLKDMAKEKEIKYFQNFHKDELVQALAFPEKAEAISAMVKERVRAKARKTRNEGRSFREEKPKPKPTASTDPFENLDAIGAKEFGYSLQKDSVLVEGQHVNVRKVFDGVQDEYHVTFKLTKNHIEDVEKAIKKQKGYKENSVHTIEGGSYDKSGRFIRNRGVSTGINSRNLQITMPDGTEVTLFNDDGAKAYKGRMIIKVRGYDGKKGAESLVDSMKKLGIEAVKENPTEEDEKLLKLAKFYIQNEPGKASRMNLKTVNAKMLETRLKNAGYNPDLVNDWTKEEVWPGYFTHVDKAGAQIMKDLGADHLFAGVTSENGIMAILKGKGLMSTTERYRNGIFVDGASSSSDIRTGGAEQVFTRLVPKNAKGKYSYDDSFSGGPYVVKIKPEVLGRTDWYAYGHDNYGKSEDYASRVGRQDFITKLQKSYRTSNEVMFRHGIQVDMFDSIVVRGESRRLGLIKKLKAEGINEINGKKIEDFIKEGSRIE